ncbi:MAG: VOC family protein [Vulcanimicrobiaceae bacterium]
MNAQTATTATGIDAHYYLVKDLERAKGFYREMLGLRPATDIPNGVEFELPDGSAFGIVCRPDGFWEQGGGTMFTVPDIKDAFERLRARGVAFATEIMESPVCYIAWAHDPDGNSFALHQRKPSQQ